MLRTTSRWLLAAFFSVAGLNHFLNPGPYLRMMPDYLPWPAPAGDISKFAG